MSNSVSYDLIIVGAGPTGLSIAIEAKAAGLNYLILEKKLLVNSIYHFPSNMTFFSTSKNLEIGQIPFISHTDKPTRREALEYYRRIMEAYQMPIRFNTEVINVNNENETFEIETTNGNFTSKNVVVATGFYDVPNMLNVPGEDLPKVKHYYDDAHHYIGMDILIIGAANSACDAALETWQKGANVTMAIRDKQLYQKVKYWILPNIENRIKEGSIKAYFNTDVTKITEHQVHLHSPKGVIKIPNDYVLAMTGYRPDFEFLSKLGIEFEAENQVPIHDTDSLESNVKGLYLAGVILAGNQTSKLFIENTRHHGERIVKAISS